MLSTLLNKPVCIDLTESGVDDATALNRQQLMDRIIAINPSATARFLDQFEDHALNHYLDHLMLAARPRGPEARWVRPARSPWACAAAACA